MRWQGANTLIVFIYHTCWHGGKSVNARPTSEIANKNCLGHRWVQDIFPQQHTVCFRFMLGWAPGWQDGGSFCPWTPVSGVTSCIMYAKPGPESNKIGLRVLPQIIGNIAVAMWLTDFGGFCGRGWTQPGGSTTTGASNGAYGFAWLHKSKLDGFLEFTTFALSPVCSSGALGGWASNNTTQGNFQLEQSVQNKTGCGCLSGGNASCPDWHGNTA